MAESSLRETMDGIWKDTAMYIAGIVVGVLAFILYGWGAAKLNWSVNQSWVWSILAFFMSPIYYPYYAFFQRPVSVFGAARRR